MRKQLFLAIFLMLMCAANTALAESDLEAKTNEVIRSACHGYALDMIPDFLQSIRTKLKKDSALCKDVRQLDENVDVQPTLRGHLTQRDLDRIYGENWRNVGADEIAFACKQEYKCIEVRKKLIKRKKKMSQKQYDQVAAYCKGDLAEYDCIENWVDNEWIAKGTRKMPQRKLQDVGGADFDDLMSASVSQGTAAATSGSIDDLMGGGVNKLTTTNHNVDGFSSLGASIHASKVVQGEIGFDNIYAGREQIKIGRIKQSLFDKGETIASRCQCSFMENSCFKPRSYDYKQLTTALKKTDETLETKKTAVCKNWKSALRGKTSDNERVLKVYLDNSNIILANLDKLDKGYDSVVTALNDKESEIKREVARQRRAQEEQQSGFDLGKFAALGAGVLIGASGGGMSGADMTQLLAGAAADSMGGVEGISNFNAGIQDITNQRVEQMRSVADIDRQVAQIESNQKPYSTTRGQETLLPSDVVQPFQTKRLESNLIENKTQAGLCSASGPFPSDATEVIFWDGGSLVCADGSRPSFHYGAWWYSLKCTVRQVQRKGVRRCGGQEMSEAKVAACDFFPNDDKVYPNKETCLSGW